jgi:hypothetical protein
MLHLGNDSMERFDRSRHVLVGQHHALRRAGRARREDELEGIGSLGRPPGGQLYLPVRWKRFVGIGRERLDTRGRESAQARLPWVRCVPAGPQDEVPGTRGAHDALDRVGRHPKVERDDDQARAHRPEVRGGEFRRRRRPRQQAIARFQPQRAQPPCRQARTPLELPVAPARGRTSVSAEAQGGSVAIPCHRLCEQVDQGRGHGSRVRRRIRSRSCRRLARSSVFDLFRTLGYAPPALDGFAVAGMSEPVAASPDVDGKTPGLGR